MLNWPPPEMAEFRDETAAWRTERKSTPSTSFPTIHHDHRSHRLSPRGSRRIVGIRSGACWRTEFPAPPPPPIWLTESILRSRACVPIPDACPRRMSWTINLFRSRDSSKKFGLHASQLSHIHLPVSCRAGTSPHAGLPKNPIQGARIR